MDNVRSIKSKYVCIFKHICVLLTYILLPLVYYIAYYVYIAYIVYYITSTILPCVPTTLHKTEW